MDAEKHDVVAIITRGLDRALLSAALSIAQWRLV
jgi:hypothetical protein